MTGKRCRVRIVAWLITAALLGGSLLSPAGASAAKRSKPKLNKKTVSIRVGKTVKLKVKKKPKGKQVKWSSNRKKVASVNKKGLVKGKKQGTAKITARVGGKKLTCKVKVKPKNNVDPTDPENPAPPAPEGPGQTAQPPVQTTGAPSPTPTAGVKHTEKPTAAPTATSSTQTTPPTETEPSAPVESTPKSDINIQEPEIPPTPEPEATPVPIPVYPVDIQVKKDGQNWADSGKTFYLKKTDGDATENLSVENGTYEVFERQETGDVDTGERVTVRDAAASVEINYFTVSYMDGTTIMSNPAQTVVLKGSTISEPSGYDFKAGYSLQGWMTEAGGSTNFQFGNAITEKTVIYAKWQQDSNAVSYTVRYYLENASGQYIENTELREDGVGGTTGQTVTPNTIDGYTVKSGMGSLTSQSTVTLTGNNAVLEFYYERQSYTITWNAQFTDGSTQKSEQKKFGLPLTAPSGAARPGYTLTWNPPLPSVMPAQHMTYTAKYTAETYTISYGLKTNEQVEHKTYEYWPQDQWPIRESYTVESDSITLPQPAKIGYTFAGWTGSNGTTPQKTVTIPKGSTGNKSYTPHWTARTDTVYYVKHYQENLSAGTYTLVETEELQGTTLATIRPSVKTYTGFSSPAVKEDKIRVDITTVSYFYTRNTYKLTWDAAGGEFDGAGTLTESKKYGESITAPQVSRPGYTFAGWSQTVADTMPAQNVAYTAKWTASSYTVSLSLKLDNQTWSAADAAKQKKTFALYSGSSKAADFQIAGGVYQATLKSGGSYRLYEGKKETDITITVGGQNVTQELKYWTVSFYDYENSSEKLSQAYALNGEYLTEPAMVKAGYEVWHWYADKDGNREFIFDMMPITATRSLYAEFSPMVYYLNLDLGMTVNDSYKQQLEDCGIYYDDVYYYEYDTEAAYLPTPQRSNYTFLGWTGANGSTPQKQVNVRELKLLEKGVKDEDDCIYFSFKANWKYNISSTAPFINPKKDILTVNRKKTALTMPVNQLVDSGWAGDQVREGVTPQGYTSYIYYDGNYKDYFVVYLSDNKVVGMATMSRNFSYQYDTNGNRVSYGDAVPTAFKSMRTSYDYRGGYYHDTGDAYVLVFTDQVGSNQGKIYAVQVFAKTVTVNGVTKTYSSLDDLIKIEKLAEGYRADGLCASQADELLDWANAYRATVSGKPAFDVWSANSQSTAQMECDVLAGNGSSSGGSLLDRYENMYGAMLPGWMYQVDGSRSPDAFGFLTWWLDSDDTKTDLYSSLVKTPEINVYYVSAGYVYKDNMSYAVMHFVHP